MELADEDRDTVTLTGLTYHCEEDSCCGAILLRDLSFKGVHCLCSVLKTSKSASHHKEIDSCLEIDSSVLS